MSDMQPVYLCINARRAEHDCLWALCYACKTAQDDRDCLNDELSPNNNKRRSIRHTIGTSPRDIKNVLNDKYDNNMCHLPEARKHMCRHDTKCLIDFSDKEYFTKTYQDKIESDEISFPMKCVDCGKRISSSE